MTRGAQLVLLGCLLVGLSGCSSDGGSDDLDTTNGDAGPTVAFESIQLLADGGAERVITLSNFTVPSSERRGTIVQFPPSSEPISIELPSGASTADLVEACPVEGARTREASARTREACSALRSSEPIDVQLEHANGVNHVGLELAGRSEEVVMVDSLRITYEAVRSLERHIQRPLIWIPGIGKRPGRARSRAGR